MKWIVIIIMALSSSGCLTMLGQKIKDDSWRDSAQRAAAFDTDCPSMALVKEDHQGRYMLQGCGEQVVYLCRNDETRESMGDTRLQFDNKTMGAKCEKVR